MNLLDDPLQAHTPGSAHPRRAFVLGATGIIGRTTVRAAVPCPGG
jgi:hypothetical protein